MQHDFLVKVSWLSSKYQLGRCKGRKRHRRFNAHWRQLEFLLDYFSAYISILYKTLYYLRKLESIREYVDHASRETSFDFVTRLEEKYCPKATTYVFLLCNCFQIIKSVIGQQTAVYFLCISITLPDISKSGERDPSENALKKNRAKTTSYFVSSESFLFATIFTVT